ncbi:MAG: succinate dehydrogenase assembly factor 2 [Rhodospirillaceae bacterium]|nr:succinate dehydrogenase assembly factor 2 [Rhodospirillaceae bacterium]
MWNLGPGGLPEGRLMPAAETEDIRRRQLRYRSWHRGSRELDLLLGRFADARLHELDAAQLERYAALLACPDPDIYAWYVGCAPAPPEHDEAVALLRRFNPAIPTS